MRIPRSQISAIVASAPRVTRAPRRHVISKLIDELRADLRVTLSKHMQPCMILLDEVVQFFIHFERQLFSKKLSKASSQFAQQISRLRSDAIAIREVVAIGQEAPAAVLARSFVEGVEIAMALAVDEAFSREYAAADDQTAFWKRQIGYGRIYPKVESFLKWAGGAPEDIEEQIANHKAAKEALSGHVHQWWSLRSVTPECSTSDAWAQ